MASLRGELLGDKYPSVTVRGGARQVTFRCLYGAPTYNTELVAVDVQLPDGGGAPVVRVDLSGAIGRLAVCVDGRQVWGTVP